MIEKQPIFISKARSEVSLITAIKKFRIVFVCMVLDGFDEIIQSISKSDSKLSSFEKLNFYLVKKTCNMTTRFSRSLSSTFLNKK